MWFISGMMLGGFLGLLIGGMCCAAGRYDESMGYKDVPPDESPKPDAD